MTRARDVADTQDNIGGAVPPFVSGKNRIINGDFGIWQRGTSFTPAGGDTEMYTSDRFLAQRNGTGATVTVSQQTFTLGAAPVAGYEGTFFYRFAQNVAGTGGTYNHFCNQRIEDVRTFAGQTVTLSFWAKADATRSLTVTLGQEFGSGGSTGVYVSSGSFTLTTSWVRYTATLALPSISGKTLGAGNRLGVFISGASNLVQTIDFWGIQLEAGSVATPFQTATGTIQGELAACQRYYVRFAETTNSPLYGLGLAYSTTNVIIGMSFPSTMRVIPTSIDFSTLQLTDYVGAYGISNVTLGGDSTRNYASIGVTSSGFTQYRPLFLRGNFSSSTYIGFSAEL